MFEKFKKMRGFTLIELLVVFAIIGLLASVIVVLVNKQKDKARFVAAKSDMAEIVKAVKLYDAESGNLSINIPHGGDSPFDPIVPKYLNKWPSAPCPYWGYSVTYFSDSNVPFSVTRVQLRAADGAVVFQQCIKATGVSADTCFTPYEGIPITPYNIEIMQSGYLNCSGYNIPEYLTGSCQSNYTCYGKPASDCSSPICQWGWDGGESYNCFPSGFSCSYFESQGDCEIYAPNCTWIPN